MLKYKLNELSVRYLFKKELIKDLGSSLNRNIELFFIFICLVFKYFNEEDNLVIIRIIEEVFIVICVVILCRR